MGRASHVAELRVDAGATEEQSSRTGVLVAAVVDIRRDKREGPEKPLARRLMFAVVRINLAVLREYEKIRARLL
jgi:hypothetical protein